jgi:hypothetical protein
MSSGAGSSPTCCHSEPVKWAKRCRNQILCQTNRQALSKQRAQLLLYVHLRAYCQQADGRSSDAICVRPSAAVNPQSRLAALHLVVSCSSAASCFTSQVSFWWHARCLLCSLCHHTGRQLPCCPHSACRRRQAPPGGSTPPWCLQFAAPYPIITAFSPCTSIHTLQPSFLPWRGDGQRVRSTQAVRTSWQRHAAPPSCSAPAGSRPVWLLLLASGSHLSIQSSFILLLSSAASATRDSVCNMRVLPTSWR